MVSGQGEQLDAMMRALPGFAERFSDSLLERREIFVVNRRSTVLNTLSREM